MEIPETLRYSSSHEWTRQDDGTVTVGITDYAQDQLGDVVFVELPNVGTTVKAGDAVAVVESVKTASDIYAPVSGEVVAVNSSLDDNPEQINASPYDAGWIFKLRPNDPADVDRLLDAEAYMATLEEG